MDTSRMLKPCVGQHPSKAQAYGTTGHITFEFILAGCIRFYLYSHHVLPDQHCLSLSTSSIALPMYL